MFASVPSHWTGKKLGYLASLKSGESITADVIGEHGKYPVYGGNGLRGYTDSFTHSGNYVLIGRQGALCGNINYAHGEFWTSEHAVVVTPLEECDVRWLGETLRAMNLNQYSVSAAQPGISIDRISSIKIAVPPLEEQNWIGDFLDRETAEIDALVAEKERMLALLEEKREALISHVVTHGLDPNASLKPSGLDWLGDIPQHWTTCQLKRTWESSDYGISENIRGEGDVKVLRMTCIEDGVVDLSKGGEVESVDPWLLLKEGDLLFNRTNSLDQIAKVGIVKSTPEQSTTFASYLVRIRTNDLAFPEFLAAYLNSQEFLAFARKNAIPAIGQANLSPSRYGDIKIALPPKSEQKEIISMIESERERTAELEKDLTHSITLLKERRSALITAAVTGQIDPEAMIT
ncbi:MAG: restriction endonuclease subunit S [Xenococcaceae cyanobacterium]